MSLLQAGRPLHCPEATRIGCPLVTFPARRALLRVASMLPYCCIHAVCYVSGFNAAYTLTRFLNYTASCFIAGSMFDTTQLVLQ